MSTSVPEVRPLTSSETAILERLLQAPFPARDDFARQLDGLRVQQVDANGSLRFLVVAGTAAFAKSAVVVEARYSDSANNDEFGPRVNILLHVAGGTLRMLEFYKDDGTKILKRADPRKLRVMYLDDLGIAQRLES